MRIYILLFCLTGVFFQAQAQSPDSSSMETHVPDYVSFAEFPGDYSAFRVFIDKNLVYPADAREKKISGIVFVQFYVEADGSVTDIKIVDGLYPSCDQAAIDVMKKSPKWIPAVVSESDNTPVRTRVVKAITFKLP